MLSSIPRTLRRRAKTSGRLTAGLGIPPMFDCDTSTCDLKISKQTLRSFSRTEGGLRAETNENEAGATWVAV